MSCDPRSLLVVNRKNRRFDWRSWTAYRLAYFSVLEFFFHVSYYYYSIVHIIHIISIQSQHRSLTSQPSRTRRKFQISLFTFYIFSTTSGQLNRRHASNSSDTIRETRLQSSGADTIASVANYCSMFTHSFRSTHPSTRHKILFSASRTYTTRGARQDTGSTEEF